MSVTPPLIGVLGGMGPLATVDFLHKLILALPAGRDQEHVPTVVWNVPQIPDRQRALAGTGESPLPAMLAGVARLNAAGATRIVIPCNTAHLWFDALAAVSGVPVIHIAEATLAALVRVTSVAGPVGLIATLGALRAEIYQQRFAAQGISFRINTDEELDEFFTPGCYAIKNNELERGGKLLEHAGRLLLERGASRPVLACTEVPIGLSHISSELLPISIDSTQALVEVCVAYWRQFSPRP